MATEGALTPAPPQLRWLAKEYGIAGVFFNHSLSGTPTMARLIGIRDSPPVIELRPGLDYATRVFAVLHECGHKVRDEEMANDLDYRLYRYATRLYHGYLAADHPAIQDFQDLYEEEEKLVNTWALGEFTKRYGAHYGSEEDFEARGFLFQHRDP